MCRNFPKLLMAPAEAIAAAKKKTSYGDALGTLIIDGIVLAIAAAIFVTRLGSTSGLGLLTGQGMGMAVAGVFVAILVGGLFFALIVKIIANTLGGKGGYASALTIIAYTIGAPAIGVLVTSIFISLAYVGPLVGFIALSIGLAMGISTLYRSIKELFATDMVTALVSVGVLTMVIATAMAFVMPMIGLSTAGLALVA